MLLRVIASASLPLIASSVEKSISPSPNAFCEKLFENSPSRNPDSVACRR